MSSSDIPTIPPLSLGDDKPLEFSRPFALEKVGNVGSVKFQISAEKEELLALAKRLEIAAVLKVDAIFNIKKAKGLGRGNKGFEVDGSAVAEIVRYDSGPSKDLSQILEFPLKLQLIEGDEETYLKTIDWQVESAKDYDIEFYQNFLIDLGEIVTQYLSLELDPFIFLEEGGLDALLEEDAEKSYESEPRVNPFIVLEKLKDKKNK
jgi:hypothetical protein